MIRTELDELRAVMATICDAVGAKYRVVYTRTDDAHYYDQEFQVPNAAMVGGWMVVGEVNDLIKHLNSR